MKDTPVLAFYPVAFLVKTSLPLLVLAAVGGAALARLLDEACFLLPAPLLFVAVMSSPHCVGMRFLVPALPAVVLLAARGTAWLSARGRAGLAVAVVLVLAQAAFTVGAAPHHLAYFNTLVGGAEGGRRLLSDSNLDWGQDLPSLAAWLESRGVREASIGYFGRAIPAAYGIQDAGWVDTPAGRLPRAPHAAISVTNLQGTFFPSGKNPYRLFAARPPLEMVAGTIAVFDAEALSLRADAAGADSPH